MAMKRAAGWTIAILAGLALVPVPGYARGFGVEVWTDRGSDAVYQPGDAMQIKTRVTDDAYLLVYEIDSEGYIRVLHPIERNPGFVEGRTTYRIPDEDSGVELVVEQKTGQGFLVALASRDPFENLPWYLRPYDPQAEGVGYVGVADDEEGVTAEGRIVGDPFVQMERIRRRVISDPNDREAFATAYTTYYVHEQVRYPRYICYDCHRPGRWQWWDGFDPYYTTCSTFDFRINWSWGWGPSYWFGNVPCYVYIPRPNCHPRYRFRPSYSSWDGWNRWSGLWGGHLTRYKTPAPVGYIPPGKDDWRTRDKGGRPIPPGILVSDVSRGRSGIRPGLPVGRGGRELTESPSRGGSGTIRRTIPGDPAPGRPRTEGEGNRERGDRVMRPAPRRDPPSERQGGERPIYRPREERPNPRDEGPREERPAPRVERPREEKPQTPREEKPQVAPDPPKQERREERPRDERPADSGRGWGGGSSKPTKGR
jgi:hypothetical protein